MAGGGIKVNNVNIRGGADGATFIPSVDANGDLSWTNNKGYENPETVNIKGPKGDKGDKGDKGEDAVSSVNGKTGDVVLNATDIKLTTNQQTVQNNINRLDERIDEVPIVSVSDTGTSTNEAKYITIDGNEYKLPESGSETGNYNDLTNKPILNQDLNAQSFIPVANTYYKHTGTTTENFVQSVIYFYNGEEYKAIDGSGSGSTQNIVDGEGLYSATVKEEPNRQNEMYGRAGLGAGHKNKYYQLDGIIGGNGNKMGLTETEFNEYWWDSTNNVPLHGGQGKDGQGRILDRYGSYYDKSYINSIMAGENGKLLFRDSANVGYQCEALAVITAVFGKGTRASKEAMFACGQFNKDDPNEDNIFEAGIGTDKDHRENGFAVSRQGNTKTKGLSYADGFVSNKSSMDMGGHQFSFPPKNGTVATTDDIPSVQERTEQAKANTIPLRQANGSFKVGRYLVNGATYRFTTLAKIDKLQTGNLYGLQFTANNRSQTNYIAFISKDAQNNIVRMDYGTSYIAYNNGWQSSDFRTITITGEVDYQALGQDFLDWFEASTEIVSYPNIEYDNYDAIPKYLNDKKQDKFTIVKSPTQTGVIATLQANTSYIYSTLTDASLTFPTGEDNAEIDFMFKSGATPTTLTLNGTNIVYEPFVIGTNKVVEIICKWYIDKWFIVITQGENFSNYYNKTEANSLLDNKVDKVTGKGLSTNDYTTEEKEKVALIGKGYELINSLTLAESVDDVNITTDSNNTSLVDLNIKCFKLFIQLPVTPASAQLDIRYWFNGQCPQPYGGTGNYIRQVAASNQYANMRYYSKLDWRNGITEDWLNAAFGDYTAANITKTSSCLIPENKKVSKVQISLSGMPIGTKILLYGIKE